MPTLSFTRLWPAVLIAVTFPGFLTIELAAQGPTSSGRPAELPRIMQNADLSRSANLGGHLPMWATPANDAGAVAPETTLHLQVLLSRPPQLQAAFEQRIADQQDRSSPNFHKWLTPAQIGQMYGPEPTDIAAVTAWLTAQGLRIDAVAASGIFIQVSGLAGVAAATFQTSLHLSRVPARSGGSLARTYRAPTTEPMIPAAFTPVVTAIEGLAEIPTEPQHLLGPVHVEGVDPRFDSSTGAHFLSRGDFAAIYDLTPVYNAGINGAGVRVAIIGRSQVSPVDIGDYEAIFSLPGTQPNVVVPLLGADPGQANNADQSEATLDVERVLGTAPGAQPDLVVSTSATGGLATAISYNVQTLLDPIMTISFGSCELNSGRAVADFYANLFAQGAAEGISTFISSGDAGAAACDVHGTTPPAFQTAGINVFCASGFVTCVGGTEFNDTANPSAYWAVSNANRTSALGYIPEGVWNDPVTLTNTFITSSGGGGPSIYMPKPAFQTGIGVPADGARDTPDISFSASGHDAYIVCFGNLPFGGCTGNASTGGITFSSNYGTSASAPSMAAIAALLDQKLGGPQGSLNPLIYRLANRVYSSAFHDDTIASSGVSNCTVAIPSMCNNSTPGPTTLTGGQPGYLLTTGYDLATGWGSLDVANFLTAAASAGLATTTKLTGSSGTLTGTQTLTFNVTVAPGSGSSASVPTGTVQIFASGVAISPVVPINASGQVVYNISSTLLPFGLSEITAVYAGDSNFEASTSNVLSLTLNPTGTAASTLTLTATPASTDPTQVVTLTATFAGTGSTLAPTGFLTIDAVDGGSLLVLTRQTPFNNKVTYITSLVAGTHAYQAVYAGDSTYGPVSSSVLRVISNPLPTTTTLSGTTVANTVTSASFLATVTGLFTNAPSTRTVVRFFDGPTLLGAVQPLLAASTAVTTTGTALFGVTLPAGSHSIFAVWPGDNYTATSTSSPLAVVSVAPGITATAASTTITDSQGSAATDVLTIASIGGYTGSANLSCAVSYAGTLTIVAAPTCSVSSNAVTVSPGSTAMSTLTIATTSSHTSLRHAQAEISKAGRGSNQGGRRLLLCGLLLWVGASFRRRKQMDALRRLRLTRLLLVVVAGSAMLATVSCSSHTTPVVSVTPGTTPATYTVTILGGPGSVTSVLGTVSVTVQ